MSFNLLTKSIICVRIISNNSFKFLYNIIILKHKKKIVNCFFSLWFFIIQNVRKVFICFFSVQSTKSAVIANKKWLFRDVQISTKKWMLKNVDWSFFCIIFLWFWKVFLIFCSIWEWVIIIMLFKFEFNTWQKVWNSNYLMIWKNRFCIIINEIKTLLIMFWSSYF